MLTAPWNTITTLPLTPREGATLQKIVVKFAEYHGGITVDVWIS